MALLGLAATDTPRVTSCPSDETLARFVEGALTGQARETMLAHLNRCASCYHHWMEAAELTRCREIATAVKMERREAWSPSPEHFRELLAQVEAAEAPEAPSRSRWAYWRARLAEYWMELLETPRPVRWALAFQSALVLVLATVLAWQTAPSFPPLYETLSSGEQPVPADQAYLRVMFAEDITEKELRALLTSLGATITQGPSKVGVYTVALAGAPKDLKPALARLRAHPKVRLAEPVSPGPAP